MATVLRWAREEVRHILPAVVYFFLALNLFYMTFGWMLDKAGIRIGTFAGSIVLALIAGKVMLIVDAMPFLNIFSGKPLIYSTAWKTLVYCFASLLFRTVEHLLPFLSRHQDLAIAWRHLLAEVWWPRFWTVQVWSFVLFFVFVVSQELVKGVGPDRLRRMFFGPGRN